MLSTIRRCRLPCIHPSPHFFLHFFSFFFILGKVMDFVNGRSRDTFRIHRNDNRLSKKKRKKEKKTNLTGLDVEERHRSIMECNGRLIDKLEKMKGSLEDLPFW